LLKGKGAGFIAGCPDLDVASQEGTVESAMASIKEDAERFLTCVVVPKPNAGSQNVLPCSEIDDSIPRSFAIDRRVHAP